MGSVTDPRIRIGIACGLALVISLGYLVASLVWPPDTLLLHVLYTLCVIIAVGAAAILFLLVLPAIVEDYRETFRDCRDMFRWIRNNYPRLVCAMRVAQGVWTMWDTPAIVELRKASERRTAVDREALERALLETSIRQRDLTLGALERKAAADRNDIERAVTLYDPASGP